MLKVMPDATDMPDSTQGRTFTLASGDLELWRIKDGRFLIYLTPRGQRNMWIELSAEQAAWLAGQLTAKD